MIALETPKPSSTNTYSARRWRVAFAAVFVLALLARIPFYATHHVQEDAYITFRAAFHLADQGDFAFNLSGHSTGVTSTIYGPYIAGIRLLFHSHTVVAISVINTLVFLAGAASLALSFFSDWKRRALFLGTISLLPMGLLLSYAGMEIPLQTAAFCAAIFTLRNGRPGWTTLAWVLLLPLIRPDAIAYSLIITALVFSFDRLHGWFSLLSSIAGVLLVLVFNRAVTGSYITATMEAKEVAYHPHHSPIAILVTAYKILVGHSYLLPVESKFVAGLSPLVTLLVLAGCVVAVRLVRRETIAFRLLLACFAAGTLIPGAYILGGVLFPWYFWTPAWLCYSLLCFGAFSALDSMSPVRRNTLIAILAITFIAVDGAQWLVSYNIGLQEYHYRGDVGRWLHQVARPTDTLELEPAGYIPFYAGLKTYDEIGLVSPKVLRYRERDGGSWWIDFLRREHPTWLVERNYVLRHVTVDGVHLSPEDSRWFDTHYRLVRHFHYSAATYLHPGLLLDAMKHGTHDDYYVFRYTPGP